MAIPWYTPPIATTLTTPPLETLLLQAGHHSEAVHAYQDTLAARGASAPSSSRLYLQLAQAYEALGFPDYALAVYTQVSCKLHRGAVSCIRGAACSQTLVQLHCACSRQELLCCCA